MQLKNSSFGFLAPTRSSISCPRHSLRQISKISPLPDSRQKRELTPWAKLMKLIASPARFKGYAVHSVYTFTIAGDSLLGRPIQIYVYWVSHYIVYKCPSLQKTIIPLLRSTQWIWSLSRHFLSNFLDSSAVLYSEWIKKRPNCGLCPNVFPTPPLSETFGTTLNASLFWQPEL